MSLTVEISDELDRIWGKNGRPTIVIPHHRLLTVMDCLEDACALLELHDFSETVTSILADLKKVPSP